LGGCADAGYVFSFRLGRLIDQTIFMSQELIQATKNGNGHKFDRSLAHELNLKLIGLISTRSTRRHHLSVLLMAVIGLVVAGLFALAYFKVEVDDGLSDLMLVIISILATSLSTLVQYWFNQQSSNDDSRMLASATSYDLGLEDQDDDGE